MSVTATRPHVLYLGDWVFHVGPVFIETPFALETKDCDLHFYGQRLADALGKEADLTTLANWQLYRLPPGKLEEHVDRSAAVVISDVEAKCFHLYPSFFDRARSARSLMARLSPSRFFSSAFRITGTIKPLSRATAIPRLTSFL